VGQAIVFRGLASSSAVRRRQTTIEAWGQCGSLALSNPYTQVPTSALPIATIITVTPLPTSAKSGPGQAPVSAQPKPKIVPPAA
jgi:hypothetical protein